MVSGDVVYVSVSEGMCLPHTSLSLPPSAIDPFLIVDKNTSSSNNNLNNNNNLNSNLNNKLNNNNNNNNNFKQQPSDVWCGGGKNKPAQRMRACSRASCSVSLSACQPLFFLTNKVQSTSSKSKGTMESVH